MAKTAIIKTVITTTGDGINDNYGDTPLASSAAAYKDETFTLANGANPLTPPTGATFLYISNGSVPLSIGGAWNIGTAKSACIPLGGGSYSITATGAGTVDFKWR